MLEYLYIGISVIIAIVLHEISHGFVSYKLGDPTPKSQGRLSLNPLKHLDPIGTLCLFLFHFGWAKPVQINPTYYKNQKLGTVFVALAGPFMNFILALLGVLVIKIFVIFTIPMGYDFLLSFISINLGLGVFNLIPFPPLDGSKVLFSILPGNMYNLYLKYEIYGIFVLAFVLYLGILNIPLSYIMNGLMTFFMTIAGL